MKRIIIIGRDNQKRIRILHGGLILAIILFFMVTPVMAYKPIATLAEPWPPGYLPDQNKAEPPSPAINYSTLTPEEQKLPPELLYLLYPDRFSMDMVTIDSTKNLQNAVTSLQNANLYKAGSVTTIDGVSIETSPNLVFLDIILWPGNSTHILDPYIYELVARSKISDSLEAWIDILNIEKIANIPEVMRIDIVTYAKAGVGPKETEGNETLHAKEVLELSNTCGGEGIRIGVISDGVNHISDAIGWGELPDNITIGNVGNGEEGIALLEIIHDLAPNASLFFLRSIFSNNLRRSGRLSGRNCSLQYHLR